METNYYKKEQNLIEVNFNKVTKDKEKYGKSLIPLTNEELEKRLKSSKV